MQHTHTSSRWQRGQYRSSREQTQNRESLVTSWREIPHTYRGLRTSNQDIGTPERWVSSSEQRTWHTSTTKTLSLLTWRNEQFPTWCTGLEPSSFFWMICVRKPSTTFLPVCVRDDKHIYVCKHGRMRREYVSLVSEAMSHIADRIPILHSCVASPQTSVDEPAITGSHGEVFFLHSPTCHCVSYVPINIVAETPRYEDVAARVENVHRGRGHGRHGLSPFPLCVVDDSEIPDSSGGDVHRWHYAQLRLESTKEYYERAEQRPPLFRTLRFTRKHRPLHPFHAPPTEADAGDEARRLHFD